MAISAAILSGGMSRRFGSDKTLANLENKPLIQWVSEGLSEFTNDIMVISKDPSKYSFLQNVRQITDQYDQQCPLVGFLAGLDNAKYDRVFFISADMPLFPFAALPAMEELVADAVVPEVNGKIYPTAAIYNKSTIDLLKKYYEKGDYKLTGAFNEMRVVYIKNSFFEPYGDLEMRFININTPEDLRKVLRLKVDKIDSMIARLLDERTVLTDEIGKTKRFSNKEIRDPGRETEILEKVSSISKVLKKEEIEEIYRLIMYVSKVRQDLC